MCRTRRMNIRGQVALEYVLTTLIFAGFVSFLWVFYQGFVQGNLYGADSEENGFFGLAQNDRGCGLERVTSFPFP